MLNKTQDIKIKIINRLSKHLNVMQTTHLQQPDHIFSEHLKRAAHHTRHVDVTRKSNA